MTRIACATTGDTCNRITTIGVMNLMSLDFRGGPNELTGGQRWTLSAVPADTTHRFDDERSRIYRTEDAIAKRLLKSLTGVGAIHADDVMLRTTRYELYALVWTTASPHRKKIPRRSRALRVTSTSPESPRPSCSPVPVRWP